jgi:hypothetical protein
MITNSNTSNEFKLNSNETVNEDKNTQKNPNAFKVADSFFGNEELQNRNIYEVYLHLLNEEDN